MGKFNLVDGPGGNFKHLQIGTKDIKELQEFLETRFQGIIPACAFLSAFSGSMVAAMAKQSQASTEDCREILEMLKKVIDESFTKTMDAKSV